MYRVLHLRYLALKRIPLLVVAYRYVSIYRGIWQATCHALSSVWMNSRRAICNVTTFRCAHLLRNAWAMASIIATSWQACSIPNPVKAEVQQLKVEEDWKDSILEATNASRLLKLVCCPSSAVQHSIIPGALFFPDVHGSEVTSYEWQTLYLNAQKLFKPCSHAAFPCDVRLLIRRKG